MPFIKIKPKLRSTASSTGTKITMGAYLSEGIGKPRHISVRIPKAIIDATNFSIVDGRTLLGLHEGVGEDVGFLMLYNAKENRNGTSASQSKSATEGIPSTHGFAANFRAERFQYYTPNEWPVVATECDHTIDDGNIIIMCPEWLRPNVEKMAADGHMKEPEVPAPIYIGKRKVR